MGAMILACSGCGARYDVSGQPAGASAKCKCGVTFVIPSRSNTAGELHCPSCNAHCLPGDSQCEYCGVSLAWVSCPSCMARGFSGAAFCSQCGAALLAPSEPISTLSSSGARGCPRCGIGATRLACRTVGETSLEECVSCGGAWLANSSIEKLIRTRDKQRLETLHSLSLAITEPLNTRCEYVPCPDCQQLMHRRNFAGCSGVVVDVCALHGTWFDKGKLGRIVKFVLDGGLDEARRREVERVEAEIERKKEKLQVGPSEPLPMDDYGVDGLLGRLVRYVIDIVIK